MSHRPGLDFARKLKAKRLFALYSWREPDYLHLILSDGKRQYAVSLHPEDLDTPPFQTAPTHRDPYVSERRMLALLDKGWLPREWLTPSAD